LGTEGVKDGLETEDVAGAGDIAFGPHVDLLGKALWKDDCVLEDFAIG